MQVIDTDRKITVTDLNKAFDEASICVKYEGSEYIKQSWLLIYYQLKVLKGYTPNIEKVVNRVENNTTQSSKDFDIVYNDSRARNLNFCGAGNMSKASSKYRTRHREKIGNLAEQSCRNKVIASIVELCQAGNGLNGYNLLEVMRELDSNKWIVDTFNYGRLENTTPLIQVHANLLLWVNKYAPKYVCDLVGYSIGKRWATN
jgi:hypothetical protein